MYSFKKTCINLPWAPKTMEKIKGFVPPKNQVMYHQKKTSKSVGVRGGHDHGYLFVRDDGLGTMHFDPQGGTATVDGQNPAPVAR